MVHEPVQTVHQIRQQELIRAYRPNIHTVDTSKPAKGNQAGMGMSAV